MKPDAGFIKQLSHVGEVREFARMRQLCGLPVCISRERHLLPRRLGLKRAFLAAVGREPCEDRDDDCSGEDEDRSRVVGQCSSHRRDGGDDERCPGPNDRKAVRIVACHKGGI